MSFSFKFLIPLSETSYDFIAPMAGKGFAGLLAPNEPRIKGRLCYYEFFFCLKFLCEWDSFNPFKASKVSVS